MTPSERAERIIKCIYWPAKIKNCECFKCEEIGLIATEIEEAEREAFTEGLGVGRETSLEHFNNGYAAAREKAAKDLRELVESNYDEYRDDCGFCGATLTKCPKWCMRNDLIEFSEALKTMKPDSDVSAHEVSNGENKR